MTTIAQQVTQRHSALNQELVEEAIERCEGLDPGLVKTHFVRVRNPERYFREFGPDEIFEHIKLFSELNEAKMVVASVERGEIDQSYQIIVAGVDLRGVSACVTGCLAELGLSITQMDVYTYEPLEKAIALGDLTDLDDATLADRYIMAFQVSGSENDPSTPQLTSTLLSRLKAAYWHLVRGDINKARHESDEQDELTGQVFDNRFRLDRRLEQGGMGTIFLATQLDLDRPVAVKVLRSDYSKNQQLSEDFRRESRLLANVNCPHIVHVYAAGIHNERCWMALEYMTGGDVAHWLARHGAPPYDVATRWLREALAGLRYIHDEVGIVHRDIKPSNMLLDARQNLKIGDLGLGQLYRFAETIKSDGTIQGTIWYMSPEQGRGEQADQRSDLFSLGSSFYHILTGARPFDGATPAEVLSKVARAKFKPISRFAPYVPGPLAVLVERLMQPDPWKRYQLASVALADLESYLSSAPVPRGYPRRKIKVDEAVAEMTTSFQTPEEKETK